MYVDINAAGCPNTCRHCSADGHLPHGKLFSLEELRRIKSEWGPLTIRFEPTAHPDFPEIYQADIATENGGGLVTNGFGIANRDDYPDIFAMMQGLGMHTLAFTLHGLEEHHDWFTCRAGAFSDILTATRRARAAGFTTHWQVFVDRIGIQGIPALIEIAYQECGEPPSLELPYHRVGGRLWHYENIRLTLKDVEAHRLHQWVQIPGLNIFSQPESLTARTWLEKWRAAPDGDDFKHPFEPPSWPPTVEFETLSIRITRNRKIYIDPLCSAPIYLDRLAEGKEAALGRLENLPEPPFRVMLPDGSKLSPVEQEELHPCGFSLRYKEISKKLRQQGY